MTSTPYLVTHGYKGTNEEGDVSTYCGHDGDDYVSNQFHLIDCPECLELVEEPQVEITVADRFGATAVFVVDEDADIWTVWADIIEGQPPGVWAWLTDEYDTVLGVWGGQCLDV